jgi:hypothetical protein
MLLLPGVRGDGNIGLARREDDLFKIENYLRLLAQSEPKLEWNVAFQLALQTADPLRTRRGMLILAGTPLLALQQLVEVSSGLAHWGTSAIVCPLFCPSVVPIKHQNRLQEKETRMDC